MHSCELITNLCAKKVLCHRVEVVKNFQCYNHRLCFLQRDWLLANSSWKSNQLNEAQGIGRRSPDPFFPRERAGSGHETTCDTACNNDLHWDYFGSRTDTFVATFTANSCPVILW